MVRGSGRKSSRSALEQSQWDCVFQPRVATQELPWVLWQIPRAANEIGLAATALWLGVFVRRRPRVARSSQPWALGRNPVGIRPKPHSTDSVTMRFVRISMCRIFLRISRGIMREQKLSSGQIQIAGTLHDGEARLTIWTDERGSERQDAPPPIPLPAAVPGRRGAPGP